jgi:hypothetical protein
MTTPLRSDGPFPWRAPGVWLTAIVIGYSFFNVFRALTGPVAFAEQFGIPGTNDGQNAFILVYALRTLFISLFGLWLLVRRQWRGLAVFVVVALVMPLGDAWLVASRGGPVDILLRHIVIALYLLLTAWLVQRLARAAH